MKVHVRKNILMVKLVCVFKVAEYIIFIVYGLFTQMFELNYLYFKFGF